MEALVRHVYYVITHNKHCAGGLKTEIQENLKAIQSCARQMSLLRETIHEELSNLRNEIKDSIIVPVRTVALVQIARIKEESVPVRTVALVQIKEESETQLEQRAI